MGIKNKVTLHKLLNVTMETMETNRPFTRNGQTYKHRLTR